VLLILADDLGHECLGSYGGTSYRTPRLDELARGGMRFERCFAMPMCHPSRLTLLTGRYPFRTHARWGTFPDGELTFGNVLQRAGYATALSGKWQMTLQRKHPDHIARSGFATSAAWDDEGSIYWNPAIRIDGVTREDLRDRYGPDVHTEFLIDFLERERTGPFLAYFPLTLPHREVVHPVPGARLSSYPEMVEEMDRQIGRVLDALERLELRESTIVLFTADNGTPTSVISRLGAREIRGGKSEITDAGTHVPLLASWPGVVPPGSVCGDLIDLSDFMPTLAELARAEPPAGVTLDGRSFAPQLRGQPGRPRDWVYGGFNGRAFLRDKRWKLTGTGDLFDLERDPDERAPIEELHDTPESAAARARLDAYVRGYFPAQSLA